MVLSDPLQKVLSQVSPRLSENYRIRPSLFRYGGLT